MTLFEEDAAGMGREETAAVQQAILTALVELLRQSRPVKLLLSFREDYLAKLRRLLATPALAHPELTNQYLHLAAFELPVLYEIIRGPFERHPELFDRQLGPEFARQLAVAFGRNGQASSVNLSEVQVACLQLWRSEDPEALFAERGVQGLLTDHFSAVLDQLPAGSNRSAVALLRRLVTSSGTRNVVSKEDLLDGASLEAHSSREELERALTFLERDARLIQREHRRDSYVYELVSEYLIPLIAGPTLSREPETLASDFVVASTGPQAVRSWRSTVGAAADRLELELALKPATLMGLGERVALDEALRHIQRARAIAGVTRTRRQRVRNWWTGEDEDRAWSSLQLANQALVTALSPSAIRVMIPGIQAAARAYRGRDSALDSLATSSEQRQRDAPVTEGDRQLLRAMLERIDLIVGVAARRRRAFRNVLITTSLAMTTLTFMVAVIGDVLYLELFGALGGAVGAMQLLWSTKGSSGRDATAWAQVLVKLPAGAAAALVGMMLLLNVLLIPQVAVPAGPRMYAYAAICGYGSLLVTRVVDRQADQLRRAAPLQSSVELVALGPVERTVPARR